MLIIPDTNFLIYISKYKLWHELEYSFGKYKLIILPEVAYELIKLSERGKNKIHSLVAIELTKIKKIKSKKGYADEAIVKKTQTLRKAHKKFIIATMDKNLIKKLKKQYQNIKILTIRQKKYLREI